MCVSAFRSLFSGSRAVRTTHAVLNARDENIIRVLSRRPFRSGRPSLEAHPAPEQTRIRFVDDPPGHRHGRETRASSSVADADEPIDFIRRVFVLCAGNDRHRTFPSGFRTSRENR